jgi:hypothetical protein
LKQTLWGDGGYLAPNGAQRKFMLELHRKYGKSTMCGIIATELCLQKPGAVVFWGAETQKQVGRFLIPIMREYVLNDCPDAFQPHLDKADASWTFPNGSQIIMGGCEDEAKCNRLRGPKCDLFIPDEAGQIELFDYLYRSVVLWMISRTGGRVIVPSTPATSPGHPFTRYCIAAENGDGGFAKRVIYDSNLPAELVEELARECGGTNTPAWQREALCERVVDVDRAIFPEFSDKATKAAIVVDSYKLPLYYDTYVSCDIALGGGDLTFVGYWIYDFEAALAVQIDELVMQNMTTDLFAKETRDRELQLWGAYWAMLRKERSPFDPELLDEPYRRTGDLNPLVVADLAADHGLAWEQTAKHDKESAINQTRVWIRNRRFRILRDKCPQTIAHLEAGIWNKRRTEFERMEGFGHFDGCDMLTYFRRNVDESHNPAPYVPAFMRPHLHGARMNNPPEHDAARMLSDMFTPKADE